MWPLPVAIGPAATSLASHTLTVLSRELLTMRLPSGEYATDLMVLSADETLPVASGPAATSLASHTLTVLSPAPLTMWLPSGEYATE